MKKLLLIILAIWGFVLPTFAGRYTVKSIPNVQLSNSRCYTSNPDNILSQAAVRAIDAACDSLRTLGKAQIAVVVVEDVESDDIFSFAHALFTEWGVGNREADNGLGVLLVTKRREIRFITGYGLEGILPDAICKRIQQRYMVEHLAAGDYSKGMVNGIAAIASAISQDGEVTLEGDVTSEEFFTFIAILALFSLVVVVLALFGAWINSRCPKCGKHHLARISSENISSTARYSIVAHTSRCKSCGFTKVDHEKIYKPTGGVIIGGFGGGNFGGGGSFGGGFGGGSFGGGGAGSRF